MAPKAINWSEIEIPAGFALNTCLRDLAFFNINRMLALKGEKPVAFCAIHRTILQNVPSAHFAPIRYLWFLEDFVGAYGLNEAHEARMGPT